MATSKKEITIEETNAFLEESHTANTDFDTVYTKLAKFAGVGIVKAIKIHKKFLTDTGKVKTVKEKKAEVITDVIAGLNGETTTENFSPEFITNCSATVGLSESSVKKTVLGYCAENEIDCTSLSTKSAVTGEVSNWLLTNKDATREEFSAWMEETGRKSNTASAYWRNMEFARSCFTAWSAS